VAAVLTALLFSACALAPSGVFARVEVACGAKALIFSNAEKFDEKVTVKATDRCAGIDSEVQVMDADGKMLERFAVTDGTTTDIHVLLRTGQWLNFVCNGTEGSCSYSVTSE
jgi:hypothetical protein